MFTLLLVILPKLANLISRPKQNYLRYLAKMCYYLCCFPNQIKRMLPVFTIIGRPNVGKSTLFNCLTKTRNALVADFPGVTRDRQYGRGVLGGRPYLVVDTGGIV